MDILEQFFEDDQQDEDDQQEDNEQHEDNQQQEDDFQDAWEDNLHAQQDKRLLASLSHDGCTVAVNLTATDIDNTYTQRRTTPIRAAQKF